MYFQLHSTRKSRALSLRLSHCLKITIPLSDQLVKMQSGPWLGTVSDQCILLLDKIKIGFFLALFCDAIKVPQIVELLEDRDGGVRLAGANLIGKLVMHSKSLCVSCSLETEFGF